ncbi:cation diffusion facilitator family transporter [Paenibacillus lactis]|uniref:cation diffusion facilitator family transporter n=1 Tax=Paenibacillus TaxID=44249 RepID=UPI00048BC6EB|nr:cation diffusion facilitator family transporter [Paenibacillus lactis]MCM3494650.1 cation diffusion facilitator family transporter [Paenibacillus lactis]
MSHSSHPHSTHDHHDHGHDHSHGHAHGHHGHAHAHMPNNKKGLTIALIITTGIMFLEFFGGLITNSLALLSDSGHMLSDAGALALSLAAMFLSAKAPSARKSYGFHRFEILAALLNGAALFVVAGSIIWEAYGRFFEPPTVASGPMMAISFIGLFANLLSAWFLMRKSDVKENINIRSAYLHVLGDALGSVGAIAAGLIMSLTSWYVADPIISVLVSLLILKSAWGVIANAVHILMEGTPAGIDSAKVREALMEVDEVVDVHDLHIWTITSGLNSLSCHLVIEDNTDHQTVLQQAVRVIEEKFNITHTTIQVENGQLQHGELKV